MAKNGATDTLLDRDDDQLRGASAPLVPQQFYVLVALAAGPRHARDVAADVARISVATVSERTTRRHLGRLHALGVVARLKRSARPATTEFALTPLGTAILRSEVTRLRSLIERAGAPALRPAAPGALHSVERN